MDFSHLEIFLIYLQFLFDTIAAKVKTTTVRIMWIDISACAHVCSGMLSDCSVVRRCSDICGTATVCRT